jgi:hypothetical protein
MRHYFSGTISALALATALCPIAAQSADAAPASPWGFNLSTYLWLSGAKGSFSSQKDTSTFDLSFIDIVDKSRRVPLGFMGRFEAHYDRFGFYLDGNYLNLQIKPVLGRIGSGVDSEMGIMDYGLMYRIFGATAAEIPGLQGKKRPNALDVYAGARTLWLGNSATIAGPAGLISHTSSSGQSFTSPVIGGRAIVDFTPTIFVLADINIGGFGAQSVDFTGGVLGMVGYRMSFFGYPASLEAGYKALRYQVDKGGPTATNATLNGPFIGFTGQW